MAYTANAIKINYSNFSSFIKGKGKVLSKTGQEGPQVKERYNSTLSLTLALEGVSGQCHALAALPTVKTQYPLYRRLGGPKGQSGWVWKILSPMRFDPRTIQPVASRYAAHFLLLY
jgi:hypothetical protein